MTQTEKKIDWCLNKAQKEGKKHKGLRRIAPNEAEVQKHLVKAQRNLLVVDDLIKLKYTDWAVSAIFYSMYHCLLAILWRHGYESRNQSCTFAVIEQLIFEKKISLTLEELQHIQESHTDHEETVVDLRELYQYGTETEVEHEKITKLQQQAKEFVTKVKILLQN